MFFHKCSADEALIRTGVGRPRVVVGGGLWTLPILHHVERITMAVRRIDIELAGQRATPTRDGKNLGLKAVCLVRIAPFPAEVRRVAEQVGVEVWNDERRLTPLITPSLTSAIRTAAAKLTFAEIDQDRDAFVEKILVASHDEFHGIRMENVLIEELYFV